MVEDGPATRDDGEVDAARNTSGEFKTGSVQGIGIAIGHGARADVHYYPITLQEPLRSVFAPLIRDRVEVFGGRDAILAWIGEWLRQPSGGYLVVTAPAGFGKTALTAALVEQTPEAFAYHFFTRLYGTDSLREDFFLRNVVQQMAEWHGKKEQVPNDLNELRALYQHFLETPLEHTRILVLDGLDEVSTWSLTPYVSRRLPKGLHVILTVRDVGQDWRSEYQLPLDQVTQVPLDGLDRSGVMEVFRAAGELMLANATPADVREAADVARGLAGDEARLDEVVAVAAYEARPSLGADPFYVRVLALDIADGSLTPDRIKDQPPSLDGYLQNWWAQFAETTDREPIADLLTVLAVALGPIGRTDLEAIAPSLVHRARRNYLDEIVHAVRRWVATVPDGYALAHPRLQDLLRKELRIEDCLDGLLEYCSRWQEHHSSYALRYYAQHLFEAGQKERLYALIDRPWVAARWRHFQDYVPVLDDLSLAIRAAREEKPPHIEAVVRCCAACSRFMTTAPALVIDVLAQAGLLRRAELIADNILFPLERVRAYCYLAERAWAAGERGRAVEQLGEAERTAGMVTGSYKAAGTSWLIETCRVLGETQRAQALARRALDAAREFAALAKQRREWSHGPLEFRVRELEHLLFWTAKAVRASLGQPGCEELRQLVPAEKWGPWNLDMQLAAVCGNVEFLVDCYRSLLEEARVDSDGSADSSIGFWRLGGNLALALADAQRFEEAGDVIERASESDSFLPDVEKRLAWACALCGRMEQALQVAMRIGHPEEAARALHHIQDVALRQGVTEFVQRAADLAEKLLERLEQDVAEHQSRLPANVAAAERSTPAPRGPIRKRGMAANSTSRGERAWGSEWSFSAHDLWRVRSWVAHMLAAGGRVQPAVQLAEAVCREGIVPSSQNCLSNPTPFTEYKRMHVDPPAAPPDDALYAELSAHVSAGRINEARRLRDRMASSRFRALGLARIAAALPSDDDGLREWLDALTAARHVSRALLEEVLEMGVPILQRTGQATVAKRLPDAIASGDALFPGV